MKSNVRLILLVFCIALALRLIYLFENSSSPLFTWPVLDEQSLDSQGLEIAAGGMIASGSECFRAPLYPIFIGAVYSISPEHRFFLVRLAQHILGAMTCLLILLIATEAFGRRTGLIAGFLAASYGPLIFFEGTILTESLFIFLNALCVACLLLGASRTRKSLLLAGGLALGLSAITRPNIMPFVPAVLLWAVLLPSPNGWKHRIVRPCLIIIPVFAIIGIVAVRNYRATGDFVLISSQGGANFFIGNNAGADGMPPPTRMVYGTPGRYRDAVEATSTSVVAGMAEKPVTPSDVSSTCYKATMEHILKNKVAWFALMARKLVLFWNNFEIRNVKDFYFWKQESFVLSALPVTFGAIAVFGLFGAIVTLRRPTHAAALIDLYVLAFMGGLVLFFICARLRLPVLVGLIPLAAAGIGATIDAVSSRSVRRIAAYSLILIGFGAFTCVDWYGIRSFNYAQEHWLLGKRHYDLGNFDKAMESFQSSIKYDSGFTGNYFFMGNCHWQNENYDKARTCYETVLQKDPSNPQALNALGAYAEIKGHPEQARELYARAIGSAPGYSKPRTNLGFSMLREKKLDQARTLLMDSLKLYDGDPETWLGLAVCCELTGDSQASAKFLQKAESLGGEAEYRVKFGKMLREIGGTKTVQ